MGYEDLAVLDTDQLNSLKELNEPGEADLVAELVEIYVSQSPQTLKELRSAISSKDVGQAEKLAHKLKGSSANLGALRVCSICEGMEERARLGNLDHCIQNIDALEKEHKVLVDVLVRDWK